MEPVFFASPDELRAWFDEHHETEPELLVGYHKKAAKKPTVKHSQAIDQALCYGWIDSVGRRIDDERWQVRFTPRRTGSVWSKVNIDKVAELTAQGLMRPAGVQAYEQRRPDRVAVYSYEQPEGAELDAGQLERVRAVPEAWAWFDRQSASYKKAAAHWVTSAKRADTRERRLTQLITDSADGNPVPPLRRR
jgi:uncharacterized protein YdeI (YjbR/CyaY-like superfamily)